MRGAIVFAVLLAGSAARAGEPSTQDAVRALEAQPGVTVSHGDDRGHAYTEWRKNGVFYRLEEQGTQDQFIGDDESGAGAVMCSWGVYALTRAALDDCLADRFPALRADLDRDIAAMEAFIVANSPWPITAAELHAEAEAQRRADLAARPPAEAKACAAGDVGAILQSLDDLGPAGRRAAMDKLLAVPRWPVLNPCL